MLKKIKDWCGQIKQEFKMRKILMTIEIKDWCGQIQQKFRVRELKYTYIYMHIYTCLCNIEYIIYYSILMNYNMIWEIGV